jgi:hypothetical protein
MVGRGLNMETLIPPEPAEVLRRGARSGEKVEAPCDQEDSS